MSPARSPWTRWLRRHSLTLVAALGGAVGVAYAAHHHAAPAAPPGSSLTALVAGARPPAELPRDTVVDTVQIALLLDTSSSMDGLINQARSHLWNVVEQMGRMTRVVDGKVRGVRLELALYEYGNSRLSAADGYLRQVLPLTGDLDRVSEALHGLTTMGGEEYAGQVITTAVHELAWSSDPGALRYVFVAGNEGFDQGRVSATTAMEAARAKDIAVQLIYCGDQEPSWDAAAHLAGSDLTTIDQDQVARHIAAPQDDELVRLGAELNGTYLAYGAEGQAASARQQAADAASARLGAKVAIERSVLKSKASYDNAGWDVVDASERDAGFLAGASDDQLPAELRGKTLDEKKKLVADKAAARSALKARIAKLEAERAAFVTAEEAKLAPEKPSLGTKVLESTRKTAAKKGWKP